MPNLIVALDFAGKYLKAANMQQVGLTNQQVINGQIQTYLAPEEWLEMVADLKQGRSLRRLKQVYKTPIGITEQLVDWEVVMDSQLQQRFIVGTVAGIKLIELSTVDCCDVGHNGNYRQHSLPRMPAIDLQIMAWLEQVQPPLPKINLTDATLFVDCRSDLQASQLFGTLGMLEKSAIQRVYFGVNGQHIKDIAFAHLDRSNYQTNMQASTSIEQMPSLWARQNRVLFESMRGIIYLHSADKDTGYRHLAVRSEITDRRLNKPVAQLLGQPLSFVDNQIAAAKLDLIESAIADPTQVHTKYYTFQDPPLADGSAGAFWRFKMTGVYLAEYDEVQTVTIDNPDDPRAYWQEGYWRNGMNVLAPVF